MKSFLLHCLFAAAGSSACLAATYPLASQQNRAGAVNDPGTVLLSTGDGSGFAAIDDTFSGQVVVTATIQFDTFGGANAHAGLELADGANPRLALGNGAGSSNWGGSAASTSFDIPGAIPVATGSPRTLSLVIDYVAGADDHATVRIDGSGATGDFTFTGDCSFGEIRVRNADCVVDFTKLSVVVIRAPQPGAANPALAFLEAGEIEPQGWIKEQMRLDLEDGYYPHYPAINSTVTHELFVHQDRFSRQGYNGLADWWSGEHEGYWKDGLLRMAFL
ncbi:MAG: hypothetical protein KDN05_10380, partial [Verrucomicrobiae bacterium]|nr:hypothetical protein [Verrucomicrobiae bacterium]